MEFFAVLAILTALVLFVTGPLRRAAAPGAAPPEADRDRDRAIVVDELEAARDAKYREIRDAELDHRTGKLSDADFSQLDAGLRAEAVAILGALDAAGPTSRDGGSPQASEPDAAS